MVDRVLHLSDMSLASCGTGSAVGRNASRLMVMLKWEKITDSLCSEVREGNAWLRKRKTLWSEASDEEETRIARKEALGRGRTRSDTGDSYFISAIFSAHLHLTAIMFSFRIAAVPIFTGRVGRRSFSHSLTNSTRFLSFEEARKWACGLGLRSAREWQSFRGRPSYIPAEPDKAYRGSYLGMADFLGYERDSRRRPRDPAIDPTSVYACPMKSAQKETMDDFVSRVRQLAPSFEFLMMPRDSRVALLFRPSSDSDGWCGLHFRSATKRKSGNSVNFTYIERCDQVALVLIDKTNDLLYSLEQSDVTMRSICISPQPGTKGNDFSQFLVKKEDLVRRLEKVYADGPVRSAEEWIASQSSMDSPTNWVGATGGVRVTNINRAGLVWLTDVVCKPASIPIDFRVGEGNLYNIMVAGRRCLLRVCSRTWYPHASRRLLHLSKQRGRESFPFDAADDIDFLIGIPASAEDSTSATRVRGCFVFPKKSLIDQGSFSRDNQGGRLQLAMYPPYVENPRNDLRVRVAQQWQVPFWIDFSGDSDSLVRAQDKFRDILRGTNA